MDEPTRHPLTWPDGTPRTPGNCREDGNSFKMTFGRAVDDLLAELGRLGALPRSIIVSSNIPIRLDGMPRAGLRLTDPDPGVAVYWTDKDHKPMAIACDRYRTVLGNLRGIALTIDALRTIKRHGTTDMANKAFSGFAALPEKAGSEAWWSILQFTEMPATWDEVNSRYRALIKAAHTDVGGGEELARALNNARDAARKHFDTKGEQR